MPTLRAQASPHRVPSEAASAFIAKRPNQTQILVLCDWCCESIEAPRDRADEFLAEAGWWAPDDGVSGPSLCPGCWWTFVELAASRGEASVTQGRGAREASRAPQPITGVS